MRKQNSQSTTYDFRFTIGNAPIEIYDLTGRMVYQSKIVHSQSKIIDSQSKIIDSQSKIVNLKSKIELDVSHLQAGMYYLKVAGQVVKFVKE